MASSAVPSPLREAEFVPLQRFLPAGARIVGGLPLSYEEHQKIGPAARSCVLIIYALDDHTIHKATMCEVDGGFDIPDDVVIGSW